MKMIKMSSMNNAAKIIDPYKKLILKAKRIMKSSKDPLHNTGHIQRMFNSYKLLTKAHPEITHSKIVIKLAIAWHDAYKASTNPKVNPILRELVEGVMSAKMFRREAHFYGLDKNVTSQTSYAIYKHSLLNIFGRKTSESKILFDLDELDLWNPVRLLLGINDNSLSSKQKAVNYLTKYMSFRKHHGFYFEWTEKKFESNLARINNLLKKELI